MRRSHVAPEPELREAGVGDAPAIRRTSARPPCRSRSPASASRGASSSRPRRSASARSSAASSPCRSPASRSCPAFLGQKRHEVDLGPVTDLRRGTVVHRDLHDGSEGGRDVAPHGVRPQQRLREVRQRAGPELHDHLEPVRPSRLPGAGERADGQDEEGDDRERPDPAARGAARRLRLPVSRRPVRHRGQPHGRARRCAASTATTSRSRTAA